MAEYIVFSGDVSSGIIIESDSMIILDGGVATITTVNSDGRLFVSFGGSANSTTVNSGGWMYVSSGGTAYSTTVNGFYYYDCFLYILSGGMADNITVNSGCVGVYSGGTAQNTTVNGGWFEIYEGGKADSSIVNGGIVTIAKGGIMNNTVFNSGKINVANDGTAQNTMVNDGMVTVYSGGMVQNTMVNGGGIVVSSGGMAQNTTINSNRVIRLSSGGTANSTTIDSGRLEIYKGGTANNTVLNDGYINISNGGLGNNIIVNAGELYIDIYGSASNVIVNSGGSFYLNGEAKNIAIKSGASIRLGGKCKVDHISFVSGGYLAISSGSSLNDIKVNLTGSLSILSGGVANDIEITDGGKVFVCSDGIANVATVSSGACMQIDSGGILTSVTVQNGGQVTGRFKYSDISFDSGAIINFDVSDLAPKNADAIIDLSGLSEAPNSPLFTLTIDDSIRNGTYKLAENAWGFNQTISVNNSIMPLGYISLDQTSTIYDNDFTLRLNDGDLLLTVSAHEPQFVYLDFDGEENTRYDNTDLNISFSLSVEDPGFPEELRIEILNAMSEKYETDGIIFTLERPETEYSTLYFGKSEAFNAYGDFFGIAESHDTNNQNKEDDAFILLDQSYSSQQIVSVASHMIDHILGYSFIPEVDSLSKYAEKSFLLTTEWGQEFPYKKYCPNDNSGRCVTGCVATAASQIINYWIETGMLNLSLHIDDSDAYSPLIESSSSPKSGHLSFAETNKLLSEYALGDENSIAALCFAVGVALRADYSYWTTNASLQTELFLRSGFEDVLHVNPFSSNYIESIILEVLQGRPVAIGIEAVRKAGHEVVLDGYDSSTNTFHLNYGWNGEKNGWYSFDYRNWDVDGIAIPPEGSPNLELINLAVKNKNINLKDDITLSFDVSNTGNKKSDATMAYFYCDDRLIGATKVQYVTPGFSRSVNCSVGSDYLKNGENAITVVIDSQNGESSLSSSELTVICSDIPVPNATPEILVSTADKVSWESMEANNYIVEYSMDNFEHVVSVVTSRNAVDMPDLPKGTYQWRVKADANSEWAVGNEIVSDKTSNAPKVVQSNKDGNADVFFANAFGTWESAYLAQHVGSIGDWGGTNEYAALYGKNKLADIIEGSTDANILLMTDDENGDALFVDDIYTVSYGDLAEKQSRIAQIDEIRAGAGDDIMDMTSQRFGYIGDGLAIHGGAGNDVIWTNKGDNFLFGDAGNDRIVGASGDDVIAGGIGNDRMHGGGGDDIFTFGENWGTDTVEQLAGGAVTLWFASEQKGVWDDSTLTYTDGANSVKVSGVNEVTLKFGDDGSEQFAALSGMGAFLDATTERTFEESGKGILASL